MAGKNNAGRPVYWWRCWKNRDSLCVRRWRVQWGASFMKASALKCGIAFGKMGICSLITQMMEPVLNIQKKRTLNEITIDASATPERFLYKENHAIVAWFQKA